MIQHMSFLILWHRLLKLFWFVLICVCPCHLFFFNFLMYVGRIFQWHAIFHVLWSGLDFQCDSVLFGVLWHQCPPCLCFTGCDRFLHDFAWNVISWFRMCIDFQHTFLMDLAWLFIVSFWFGVDAHPSLIEVTFWLKLPLMYLKLSLSSIFCSSNNTLAQKKNSSDWHTQHAHDD